MNPKDYNLRQFRQGPTEASTLPPAYQGDTAPEILAKLVTVDGMGSGLDADLLDGHDSSFYAPIGNAALTGNPTAPTPSFGDNDTSIATTAFVLANAAPIANPSANLLINGDMAISQENGPTAIHPLNNTSTYVVDQWQFAPNQATNTAAWYAQEQPSSAYPGLMNQLIIQATTAWTAGNVNDVVALNHLIEGQRWAKLGWGTPNALPVSIGFWVYASVTGNFALGIRNAANNRNYVTPISITVAGVWQYKTVTIPGDIAGTWVTDTNLAAIISFCFGCGSTYSTSNINVWQAGIFVAQIGITNFFAANGNGVLITGVSLIPGNTPVPLEQSAAIRRDPAEEVRLCQRYFQSYPALIVETSTLCQSTIYPVEFRIAPTITGGGAGFANSIGATTTGLFNQTTRNTQVLKLNARL